MKVNSFRPGGGRVKIHKPVPDILKDYVHCLYCGWYGHKCKLVFYNKCPECGLDIFVERIFY